MESYVLVRPVISEKSMRDAMVGKYTFEVCLWANKRQIAGAVANQFGVEVMAVKTTVTKGKVKRVGRKRVELKEKDVKKAVVEVKKGQKIDIFEVKKE